ncbi:septum formation protein Maf [Bacteriovorax sp. Seq25_V]|nr:septum formation protein Maf [Bacteriovorax sp. Seq25_V]
MILASASPRRKELLGWLGVPVKVSPSGVEEITEHTIPSEVVADLAALKGRDIKVREANEDSFIVASDTIVVIDDEILGKPKDRAHAREMLLKLSGRKHEVYTAVYMGLGAAEKTFVICSEVTFTKISDEIMDLYLEGDEALDKAGAYGIQGQGLLFVEKLTGSYSNVVGFPLSDFIREMKSFLAENGYNSSDWRSLF